MMWVKLDDAILDNKKILEAGLDGFALYVAGLVYSSRNLTDGFIPLARVVTLLPWRNGRVTAPLASRLCALKLWQKKRDGYLIHDYFKYNPTRAAVLRVRQGTAERMRRLRTRDAVTNASVTAQPGPGPVPIKNIINPPTPLHPDSPRPEGRSTPTVEQTKAYLTRIRQQSGGEP